MGVKDLNVVFKPTTQRIEQGTYAHIIVDYRSLFFTYIYGAVSSLLEARGTTGVELTDAESGTSVLITSNKPNLTNMSKEDIHEQVTMSLIRTLKRYVANIRTVFGDSVTIDFVDDPRKPLYTINPWSAGLPDDVVKQYISDIALRINQVEQTAEPSDEPVLCKELTVSAAVVIENPEPEPDPEPINSQAPVLTPRSELVKSLLAKRPVTFSSKELEQQARDKKSTSAELKVSVRSKAGEAGEVSEEPIEEIGDETPVSLIATLPAELLRRLEDSHYLASSNAAAKIMTAITAVVTAYVQSLGCALYRTHLEADLTIKALYTTRYSELDDEEDTKTLILSEDTDYRILFSDCPQVDCATLQVKRTMDIYSPYFFWMGYFSEANPHKLYQRVIRVSALMGNDYTTHRTLVSAKTASAIRPLILGVELDKLATLHCNSNARKMYKMLTPGELSGAVPLHTLDRLVYRFKPELFQPYIDTVLIYTTLDLSNVITGPIDYDAEQWEPVIKEYEQRIYEADHFMDNLAGGARELGEEAQIAYAAVQQAAFPSLPGISVPEPTVGFPSLPGVGVAEPVGEPGNELGGEFVVDSL